MKSKILFFVQVPPPIHGASLRNLSLVKSEYLNSKFDIDLLPIKFAKTINDIGSFSISKLIKLFTTSASLTRKLLSKKYSFVYFTLSPTGGAFKRDLLFVLILKVFNKKRVYHLRGMGILKSYQHSTINQKLYNWVFKNSLVICLSNAHLNDISGLPYKKTYVVNNGIYISEYSNRISYSTNNNTPIKLLFLSNYVISKGVKVFIDAVKSLVEKGCTVEATMVGADADITQAELLQYIKNLHLQEYIQIFGKVTDDKTKFNYFNTTDVFVFPTYYPNEVFPGVILEAMQCGCAVVTTKTGVIQDIISNNIDGFIVDEITPIEIANKIEFLINNREHIVTIGKNAQSTFFNKFTMKHFEENISTVFEDIIQ